MMLKVTIAERQPKLAALIRAMKKLVRASSPRKNVDN